MLVLLPWSGPSDTSSIQGMKDQRKGSPSWITKTGRGVARPCGSAQRSVRKRFLSPRRLARSRNASTKPNIQKSRMEEVKGIPETHQCQGMGTFHFLWLLTRTLVPFVLPSTCGDKKDKVFPPESSILSSFQSTRYPPRSPSLCEGAASCHFCDKESYFFHSSSSPPSF